MRPVQSSGRLCCFNNCCIQSLAFLHSPFHLYTLLSILSNIRSSNLLTNKWCTFPKYTPLSEWHSPSNKAYLCPSFLSQTSFLYPCWKIQSSYKRPQTPQFCIFQFTCVNRPRKEESQCHFPGFWTYLWIFETGAACQEKDKKVDEHIAKQTWTASRFEQKTVGVVTGLLPELRQLRYQLSETVINVTAEAPLQNTCFSLFCKRLT